MNMRPKITKHALLFGGAAAWGLLLISCVVANRAVLAPPQIAGAHYVGTKECAQCHTDVTDHFRNSTHAKVALADPKVGDTGCEACHGPGSIHVAASNGPGGVTVTVRDSGTGITTEHLPHLFDRFWRADKVRSRAEGGAAQSLRNSFEPDDRTLDRNDGQTAPGDADRVADIGERSELRRRIKED